MLDRVAPTPLRAVPGPALPVEALVLGRPVAEAAALLPRLFNLCRAAQGVAAALALDLPPPTADIGAEIRRDHLLKLFVQLPGRFGRGDAPPALTGDAGTIRAALFGPAAAAPTTTAETDAFLASGHGLAPLLGRIAGCFGQGVACANGLPLAGPDTGTPAAENSPAARRAAHPALAHVEATHGRGPLWRVFGRALDLDAVLSGDLPAPRLLRPGTAQVPATRGLYTVTATQAGGLVTGVSRLTPTDHLLAPGGILALSLATLPADRAGLAPLLLDILDPCSPVRLAEVADA
ncbi:hydrogenase expression/formation protein HupK [Roseicyclus persicicus]|nr:hydrogenase expression/formation protein HupK [Roseibacterium persicicum]